MSVPVGNLADEVMKQLNEYAEVTTDGMKKAVNDAGKTVRKEIQSGAPVRSGKYKKSWTVKKTAESATTADPRGDGLVKARTGDSTTTTAYNGWYSSVYTPVAPTPPSGGST